MNWIWLHESIFHFNFKLELQDYQTKKKLHDKKKYKYINSDYKIIKLQVTFFNKLYIENLSRK